MIRTGRRLHENFEKNWTDRGFEVRYCSTYTLFLVSTELSLEQIRFDRWNSLSVTAIGVVVAVVCLVVGMLALVAAIIIIIIIARRLRIVPQGSSLLGLRLGLQMGFRFRFVRRVDLVNRGIPVGPGPVAVSVGNDPNVGVDPQVVAQPRGRTGPRKEATVEIDSLLLFFVAVVFVVVAVEVVVVVVVVVAVVVFVFAVFVVLAFSSRMVPKAPR
mmetsp:Transcript_8082/g.23905  ORF Transcript_8082/g.23905 Transcript_8082/m.23905 type:complete len:215 (+) Transcript_8082:229-873(+)